MNFLTETLAPIASNAWFFGAVFIIVLSVLVFVHEWGHFIVAKMCGVGVETFSIGFGKELFGWNDKHGTRWKFSLIPLGGYVKMFGDVDPASAGHVDGVKGEDGEVARPFTDEEKKKAFFAKPVAQRAAVVFAGPAINFIFAILLLFGLYVTQGQPVTPPIASGVMVGSAAEAGGFEPHDEIIQIDGEKIKRFEDIRRVVAIALNTQLQFTVLRGGEEVTFSATPKKEEITDRFGFTHSQGLLGILGPNNGLAVKNIVEVNGQAVSGLDQIRDALFNVMGQKSRITIARGADADGVEQFDQMIVATDATFNADLREVQDIEKAALIISDQANKMFLREGIVQSFGASITETFSITVSTLKALGQMVTGTRSATELGGIIRIGAIAGDMAQAGFIAIVTFTALLSINLGLINLFPIPMLDGGHLTFYAIEALKGKPLSERTQEYAFRFGFGILIALMLFANLNDLYQLFIR